MSIEEILLTKFDLEEILDESLRHETLFNIRLWNHQKENEDEQSQSDMICSKVSLWLRESRTSFVSPAYFYNEFIDSLVKNVWWDDIKYSIDEDDRESSTLREHKKNLLFQNCLVSIKMGLDRYVSLLSNYNKGVPKHSTFGHITTTEDGNEKAKGFMSYVLRNKESDDILRYIYNEYNYWIKVCVYPRDGIMHYQDSVTCYDFLWDEVHDSGVLWSSNVAIKEGKYMVVDYAMLKMFVDKYYSFFEKIMKLLMDNEDFLYV